MFTDKQEYDISNDDNSNNIDSNNDFTYEDEDNAINYNDDVFENLNKDDIFFRNLYNFVVSINNYKWSKISFYSSSIFISSILFYMFLSIIHKTTIG